MPNEGPRGPEACVHRYALLSSIRIVFAPDTDLDTSKKLLSL
jgi:hypothetical protein